MILSLFFSLFLSICKIIIISSNNQKKHQQSHLFNDFLQTAQNPYFLSDYSLFLIPFL